MAKKKTNALRGHKGFVYTVEGQGEFPLDMLRHSQSWPYDGQSVYNMTPGGSEVPNKNSVCIFRSEDREEVWALMFDMPMEVWPEHLLTPFKRYRPVAYKQLAQTSLNQEGATT